LSHLAPNPAGLPRLFAVFSLLILPLFFLTRVHTPVYAATTDNLNFQARLQTSPGAIATDGNYNVEFKLYDATTGGTLLWTETRDYNGGAPDHRVRVANGYLTVNLGDVTAFPTNMPWDQQLYLTMNIGGTGTSNSWDGEMSPRLKLTAVPYAFNAKTASQLLITASGISSTLTLQAPTGGNQIFQIPDQGAAGTYTLLTGAAASGSYIQLQGTTPGTPQTGNFNITGTGIAATGLKSPTISLGTGGSSTGSIELYNANNTNKVTITTAEQTAGDVALTIPNVGALSDTICLLTLANCLGGASGGANTSLSNIISTNLGAPLNVTNGNLTLQTTTSGDVNITPVGSINLNQNTTIAAGKSITVTGGNTASRPASPTEGMVYFDTTTKQLLTYSNGKWQSDRSTATKIVAASNSSQALKDSADYVATGTNDQTTINTALTAAAGGRVYMAEGTYTISATISIPNNTTLAGAGTGTLITIPNSFNANINAITNTTTGGNGTGITIQDLRLDGNKANQTAGNINGIYLNGVGSGTGSAAIQGAKVTNIRANNWRGYGFYLNSSSNNTLIGNTAQGNSEGFYLYTSSNNNTLTGNTAQGNGYGFDLYSSSNNTLTGNTAQGNTYAYGFYLNSSSNNTLTGNTAQGNSEGFDLSYSSYNTLTGNTTQGNGYGFRLDHSLYNTFAGNNSYGDTTGSYFYVSSYNTIIGNNIKNSQHGWLLTSSSNNNTLIGNTAQGNSEGFYLYTSSNNNTLTGNTAQGNTNYGFYLDSSSNNTITGNNVSNTGGNTANNGIYLSSAGSNTVVGNTITDTSATTNNYAINIDATSNTNYLADNVYSSTPGTSIINDAGTGTVFANQSMGENGTNVRNRTANSTTAFSIQNANGVNLLNIDSTNGTLQVGSYNGGTNPVAGKIVIANATNANTVTVISGVQTGNYTLTIPVLTSNADICLSTGNCSGMSAYIQNQNASAQATSTFWISNTGRSSTSFLAPLFDTANATALSIATANATDVTIGGSNITGTLSLDSGASSTINIGSTANARTVNVGTGAAAQALNLGSQSGTSVTTIQAGTGTAAGDLNILAAAGGIINIAGNNVTNKLINIGSTGNTPAASSVNIATTNANATQSVNIGSTTSANNVVFIQGGTSTTAIRLAAGASGTVTVGSQTAANTVNIGTVGSATYSSTVNIATSTGAAQAVTISSTGNSGNTVLISGGTGSAAVSIQAAATGTIAIGTINSNTLTFGNSSSATSINLNQNTTLAAGKGITFAAGAGNFDQSASTGTFATGTGAVSLNGNTTIAANKSFTANGSALFKDATNSTTAFSIQNAAGTSVLNVNTTDGIINVGTAATYAGYSAGAGFAAKVDYTTGSTPRSVTSADVNGDTYPDILVVNADSTSVSVLLNNGNGTFAAKVDYTTGSNPYDVTTVDVNGDGKPDIITANNSSNTVSVLLNNGNGTFAAKVDYTTGSSPRSVTSADVNGDTYPDILVVNADSTSVSVLLNNGNGTFAAKVDYTVGAGPIGVAAADVDSDGRQDLIVANNGSNNISVLINNGSGTFAAKVDYTGGSWQPQDVTTADVNGDTLPDILVANSNSSPGIVTVFINNGGGTFAAAVTYSTDSNAISVVAADFNNDSKPDILTANWSQNTVSVLLNGSTLINVNSNISTTITDTTKSGFILQAAAGQASDIMRIQDSSATNVLFNITASGNIGIGIASPTKKLDVNGSINARADLYVGSIKRIDSTGNLLNINNITASGNTLIKTATNSANAFSIQNAAGTSVLNVDTTASTITLGNAAGSGLLINNGATVNTTLALGNFATGSAIGTAAATVDIYTSISVAQTTTGQTLTVPSPTASTNYGRILYLSNVGTANFTLLGTLLKPGATATLVWSNTNGGASWQYAGSDGNSVLNQNSSTQTANFLISGTGTADILQGTTKVLTAILDADSAGTLTIGSTNASTIKIGKTTANTATNINGTVLVKPTTGNDSATAFRVQNAAGTSVLNVDTTNKSINIGTAATYGVYLPGSNYAGAVNYSTGSQINNITVGDLNGDGYPDIVTLNKSSTVSVLLSDGVGGFVASTDYTASSSDYYRKGGVAISDVNKDGHNDIVTSASGAAAVSVLMNNGNGTFATRVDYGTAGVSTGMVVTDVNGDTYPDIVNVSANTISVLMNNGNGTFATRVDYTATGAFKIASGDVNGDTKPDILLLTHTFDGGPVGLTVLLNNGTGGFPTPQTYATGGGTGSDQYGGAIVASDFNNDGHLDVALLGWDNPGSTLSVHLNDGSGGFASYSIQSGGSYNGYLATVDSNGDGIDDLAITNSIFSSLNIYSNNGSGVFSPSQGLSTSATDGDAIPYGVDLNLDGKEDIITGNDNAGTVGVYINGATLTTVGANISTTINSASKSGLILQAASGQTADILRVQDSNGTGMYLIVSGAGNVGVGKSVPGFKLDVVGDINTSANLRVGGTIRIDNTGNLLNINNITASGNTLIKTSTNSANAFSVQNAAGTSVLNVDTTGNNVTIGTSDTVGTLLVLDTKTDAGDPTGVNGGMYYSSDSNTFRCYENGSWKDCLTHHIVTLGSDTANANATACTPADVAGLSFSVVSGKTYRFHATIAYTAAATTTGSLWRISAPSVSVFTYVSRYGLTASSETINNVDSILQPTTCSASSPSTSGTTATIEGVITPSANGTVVVQYASGVSSSAITAKAGSTIEWW
jgi:parallel beta-helix repeat protein